MGKRELLLAVAFVMVGLVVYRFTAPPPDPNSKDFSFSDIIEDVRREVRGRPESAEVTQTFTRPAPESLREIRLRMPTGAISITGENRSDIQVEFQVRSNGYDKAEAEQLAKASVLKFDEAASVLILSTEFPEEGTQRPTLRMKVPARLGIRIDEKNGELNISNVAQVAMGQARAATTISQVAGAVSLTQRGSTATLTDVGSLKLTTSVGAKVRVSQVRGDATFNAQTGELRVEGLSGGLELESRSADIEIGKIEGLTGPVRVNANMGKIVFLGLQADTRIDGRQSEIRVSMAAPAPLAIYNEGDEPIEVTVPPGGFAIDALSINSEITLDAGLEQAGLSVKAPATDAPTDGRRETRVAGAVRGGGPTITLRATRGDIVLRSK